MILPSGPGVGVLKAVAAGGGLVGGTPPLVGAGPGPAPVTVALTLSHHVSR